MFGFVRHPLFIAFAVVVVVCFFAGGPAAGGHVIASWGHDIKEFFDGFRS